MLVFGILLVVVGVTATAQAVIVSANAWTGTLNATVTADTTVVRGFLSVNLTPSDLEAGALSADRVAALERQLEVLTAGGGIVRAAIVRPDGLILASDLSTLSGMRLAGGDSFERVVSGRQVDAELVEDGTATPGYAAGATTAVLREYMPVIANGRVYAVFALWRDAGPMLAALDASRWTIVLVTLTCAAVVAVLLFFLFRTAQQRISRQTAALLEADRRDPLTGALNHGTVVAELARRLEGSGPAGVVEVALVDVDGFRSLNETYGHQAGDRALLEVDRLLASVAPPSSLVGRYGPDEFLVVVDTEPGALEPALSRLREALAQSSLRFGESDPLPLTLSAGICRAPLDARSVTELLSIAAVTLAEAKASGGDDVRVAAPTPMAPTYARTFDVLQGLVIAVDTKDRYTKRHCDDVARYADFLAERLGLPPDVRRPLRIAGLLHDVGKIGIPDAVLRKPGKLTRAEFEIMKQHVALGDMIVRDLPDLDLVRAGIRLHHERWDGTGYLDGRAGEEIPLIPRILAVADAFSAMTTDRPYRKALPVDEATKRLEDAAGSQLDASLVAVFVAGVRESDRWLLGPLPAAVPDVVRDLPVATLPEEAASPEGKVA